MSFTNTGGGPQQKVTLDANKRSYTESEPSAFAGGDPVRADSSLEKYYQYPKGSEQVLQGSTPDFHSGVEGKAPPSALPLEGARGSRMEEENQNLNRIALKPS